MEQDELSPEHAEQQLHPARDADEPPEDSAPELVPSELTAAEQGALLTALLFSAGEVLSAPRLAEYFNVDPAELDVLAAEAAGRLRPLGLDILQAAGGLRLVTASQWDAQLSGFHRHSGHRPGIGQIAAQALGHAHDHATRIAVGLADNDADFGDRGNGIGVQNFAEMP